MNEIIDSPKGKAWISRHNACSMFRQLFMGKIWDWKGYRVVIRQDVEGKWRFGCLATKTDTVKKTEEEVLLNLDMTINEFLGIMSNENILFEKFTK